MKHTRRILALVLALVLTMGLCVTTFAEGETTTGTITISRADSDDMKKAINYQLYRIFDIESYDDDAEAYAYKIADDWAEFFGESGAGKDYITRLDNNYVSWAKGSSAEDAKNFAKLAIAYAEKQNLAAVGSGTIAENVKTAAIGSLPLGYYLIDSSLGSLCALTPTKPNANVTEKNGYPTVDKIVYEGDDKKTTNDGAVGDTVTFQVTVNVTEGASKYVVHDSMKTGLKLGTISVKKTGAEQDMVEGTDYTVKTVKDAGVSFEDGCTFELTLVDDKITAGDEVVITYTGIITEDAVSYPDGVINEAVLDYGDSNRTTKKQTRTYTWDLDVYKFTKNGDNKTPLAGAKFVLYKQETGEDNATTIYAVFENGIFKEWTTDRDKATTLISAEETGKINVKGLDAGTYYLEETAAPAGYNKLKEAIQVVISSEEHDGTRAKTVKYTYNNQEATAGTNGIEVENQTGTELPSTGGIGTTVFYVLGSAMALGAVILLVTKKRMAA